MFSQHLLRATSLNTTNSLLRPYDGSVLRPDKSSISQMTFNEQEQSFKSQPQKMEENEQLLSIIADLKSFKDLIQHNFATVDDRLSQIEKRLFNLENRQTSIPISIPAQVPLPPMQHPLATNSGSFSSTLLLTPQVSSIQKFYQILGQQIFRYSNNISPEIIYNHFLSIFDQVASFTTNINQISSKLNMNLQNIEIQTAYDQIYSKINNELLYFVQQSFDFKPLLECYVSPVVFDSYWKEIFHISPKIGENYQFESVFGSICLLLILKFKAQALKFTECFGTLGEFQQKFGLKSDKSKDSKCQVVLPQWVGGISIPAYVRIVK